ncbi:hypothetical protein D4764_0236800, partial [Takifugu flavidus]
SCVSLSAPVSTVRLMSECLSQGEKRMSCSSVGDSPQYSWTLDGDTLTDDQLLSGNNETNEIILKQTVSGRLVCLVRNHVSEASVTEMISTCAPVSTVRLMSECLSQGEKRMSCSSVGDSPQYSWTLDGDTLTDDQLLSGNNETNEIILKQTVSGRLVCLVRNHVSEASVTEVISTCDNVLLTLFFRALVMIFIFSGIFIYFSWKKKKIRGTAEGSAIITGGTMETTQL